MAAAGPRGVRRIMCSMGAYVDVGPLQLWYDERPGPTDPSHPPVVLLHGGTAHAGTWAFHFEGTLPEFFGDGEPESDFNPLRDDYARMSPDGPEHWSVVNSKIVAMWRSSPQLVEDDLARIDVPFLVLVADDDAVALEHTLAQYRALPRGQLAVVPGTSHVVPVEKPDLVNRLVVDFLDDGAVVSILPMRRAR